LVSPHAWVGGRRGARARPRAPTSSSHDSRLASDRPASRSRKPPPRMPSSSHERTIPTAKNTRTNVAQACLAACCEGGGAATARQQGDERDPQRVDQRSEGRPGHRLVLERGPGLLAALGDRQRDKQKSGERAGDRDAAEKEVRGGHDRDNAGN
jgi:hypothetical protein